MSAAVVCDQVTRIFRIGGAEYRAVNEVDCQVMPGDTVALVGPSGSGKSTLLHMMAGLDTPDSGSVSWPALEGVSRGSRIGVVFQAPSLVPDLTVLENVQIPLLVAGQTSPDCRDHALLALTSLDLESLAERLPDELSGGQSQRVAVARAVAMRPSLLLADEPTGQLDREAARTVVDTLLHATAITGAGLVIASHDEAVAAQLDLRWAMADGRVRNASAVAAQR